MMMMMMMMKSRILGLSVGEDNKMWRGRRAGPVRSAAMVWSGTMDVVARFRIDMVLVLVVGVGGAHRTGPKRLLVVDVLLWVDAAVRTRSG